jgi:hypothetical protein
MSAAVPIYDSSANVLKFDNPQSFGVFFHEYAHFLQNISTVSGIAALINTLELWRCFRGSLQSDGSSTGSSAFPSEQAEHVETLLRYLEATRRSNEPRNRLIQNPASLKIVSCGQPSAVTGQGGILSTTLNCEAELTDRGGQVEKCTVAVGTLELLECAAWLLERRAVHALDSTATVPEARIFPYHVAAALADYLAPGLDADELLGCILAALQSSDAPAAFPEVLTMAREAIVRGEQVLPVLRASAQSVIVQKRFLEQHSNRRARIYVTV